MKTSTIAKAQRLRANHAAPMQSTAVRWPTPQDYHEAVQNPRLALSDEELRDGKIATDALGLPRVISGSFASVYRIDCEDRTFALRCFLNNTPAMEWRYGEIARALQQSKLEYTVNFDYQPEGISVNGAWYPLLKMEWYDGETLEDFLRENHTRLPMSLPEQFKQMCNSSQQAGIAHGDLQHANILIRNSELRLVDYDGMYVPSMAGCLSDELGHRNYQHPKRTKNDCDSHIDNFSAWVIYLSLKAIAIDHTLYDRLGAGDDCMLFRAVDFLDPLNSCTFATLEKHPNEELNKLARFVRWQLQLPLADIPYLSAEMLDTPELPPLNQWTPQVHAQKTARLPEWIHQVCTSSQIEMNNIAAARAQRTADWHLLQAIEIDEPCTVSWNSMRGNDRVRNCGHCNMNVYNIATLTEPEAIELIKRKEGRLCLRVYRRWDGTVTTRECLEQYLKIRKAPVPIYRWAKYTACLSLLGILTGLIMLPNVSGAQGKKKVCGIKADMHTMQLCADSFATDTSMQAGGFRDLMPYLPGGGNCPDGQWGTLPERQITRFIELPMTKFTVQQLRENPTECMRLFEEANVVPEPNIQYIGFVPSADRSTYALMAIDGKGNLVCGNLGPLVLSNH